MKSDYKVKWDILDNYNKNNHILNCSFKSNYLLSKISGSIFVIFIPIC